MNPGRWGCLSNNQTQDSYQINEKTIIEKRFEFNSKPNGPGREIHGGVLILRYCKLNIPRNTPQYITLYIIKISFNNHFCFSSFLLACSLLKIDRLSSI